MTPDKGLKALALLLVGLLTICFYAPAPQTANAQQPNSTAPAWWRHSAPNEISHVFVADLVDDAQLEIGVVSSNGVLEILTGNGALVSGSSYSAGGDINTILATSDLIVYATSAVLAAIDKQGTVIWSHATQSGRLVDAIQRLPGNETSAESILVTYSDGHLELLDTNGRLLWQYQHIDTPTGNANGRALIADIDRDGIFEIFYSYNTIRQFNRFDRIDARTGDTNGSIILTGDVSAIALGDFGRSQPVIAVGNQSGEIVLIDGGLSSLWVPRTLNRPILSLNFYTPSNENPQLMVGTDVGKLVTFDPMGRRIMDATFCIENEVLVLAESVCSTGAYARVEALTQPPRDSTSSNLIAIAVTLVLDEDSAEIVLLDKNFNISNRYNAAALTNSPLFSDINEDGQSEILLPTFGSLELVSPGTKARITSQVWEYPLAARPSGVLTSDLDRDGNDDLIVAAADGRIHRLSANSNIAVWIQRLAGELVDMAIVTSPIVNEEAPALADSAEFPQSALAQNSEYVAVAYNSSVGDGENTRPTSSISLLNANGNPALQAPIALNDHTIRMLIDQNSDRTQLSVALASGEVRTYELIYFEQNQTIRWQARFKWSQRMTEPAIYATLLQRENDSEPRYVFAGAESIEHYDAGGQLRYRSLNMVPGATCGNPADLLRLLETGGIGQQECIGGFSLNQWRDTLGTSPTAQRRITDKYSYVPQQINRWQRIPRVDQARLSELVGEDLDVEALVANSELNSLDGVTAWYSGDVTGDRRPDMVMGFDDGRILFDLNASAEFDGSADTLLQVTSGISAIEALHDARGALTGLVVITENSLVRLYRFQPNHLPLLVNARANVEANQYTIEVDVFDIEGGEIVVSLDRFNPETSEWDAQEPQQRTNGAVDNLRWQLPPTGSSDPVTYRFRYADSEDHVGLQNAPNGPPETFSILQTSAGLLPLMLLILITIAGYGIYRWRQRAPSRAWRFYRLLSNTPLITLNKFHLQYDQLNGDAEFFATLANYARSNENPLITDLADGLYLLADRPAAGLEILNNTLDEIADLRYGSIMRVQDWQARIGLAHQLVDAPTLTELSLVRPQFDELLAQGKVGNVTISPIDALEPAFDALTDSERVATVGDRLAYLADADKLLRQLETKLEADDVSLNGALVAAIVSRWRGLVRATGESLRGRARLDVRLKTQRIVPGDSAEIVLEVWNTGRAEAEDVRVTIHTIEQLLISNDVQTIPTLTSDWKRTVLFRIRVPDTEQFRISFTIEYNDRQRNNHSFDYADIVQVLVPATDFKPILNPYSPGTPLRQNSALFFGRNSLFNFIAGEAERASQQHVLILVGQRRTGKTSALLRLQQHLPQHLVPVYIDCQSLGVLPGMTAFFQDIAWLIADTLDARGIEVDVPELETLDTNPGNWFQHHFIPHARGRLPEDAKLVLVFDEFEALESLVTDRILPRTIFSYLRHLMQHGEGLSFIFVGTHRLEEMTTDYWSVLFNIALYKEISYLDEQAALALITEPVAPHLIYDDLALDKILRVTAGHPYFLQLVSYSLVKQANLVRTGYVTIADVNKTIDEMLSLGEVHFAYIWQGSDSAERIVLLTITHLLDKENAFRPADIIKAITPYQITVSPVEVTAALDSLVRRNIMREINDGANTLYEIKLGLVGYWIERRRSLNQLYTRGEGRPQ